MAGQYGNIRAGRAFVEITLDRTKLERGLAAAQRKLKSFGSSAEAMGRMLLKASVLSAAPFAFAAKTFADFDDEMRMTGAVTGAAASGMRMLTDTAEKLGRETSFTAKQVAEGMTALGRMGFTADEIGAAISPVLNLARATGTELGAAAETAANNMRVFGLSVTEMTDVADLLTATANGSAQTLADLSEGLKMAGPQAAAAGDSVRSVAASLGVLANMGIRGSLAGTALRKAYSQFAKIPVQKKLAEFRISAVDGNGNLREMPAIMADIAKAMDGMPSARKLAFAEEIFDLRGSLAGLQLGGNIAQLRDFLAMLGNTGGRAEETAAAMDAGLGGSFRRFMSALEGVQIAVGRIIGDALTPLADRISLMLNRLAEWAAAHRAVVLMILKAAGAAAAAGAALVGLGLVLKTLALAAGALNAVLIVMKTAVLAPVIAVKALAGACGLLTAALTAAKTAALACWAAVSSPAILAAAALAAVTAAVWKLTGAWDICAEGAGELLGHCREAFAGIGETFGKTWEAVKTALGSGDLAGAAKAGTAALKLAWLEGTAPLEKAWLEFRNVLADAWTVTVYGILKLGNSLWHGLLYGMRSIGDALADAWAGIWNGICDVFADTCEWLEKQWVKLATVFDSGEVTDAAMEAVGRKYADAKTQRESRFAEAVRGRQGEREDILREKERTERSLDAAMEAEIAENGAKFGDLAAKAGSGIEAARAEWQAAVEAVKRNAAEREEKIARAAEKTERASRETGRAAAASGGEDAMQASWSLRELAGLFGGYGWEERTAEASERTASLQEETNRYLRKIHRGQGKTSLSYGE